jgi:nitrate ABC transporter ATP-binding subunit
MTGAAAALEPLLVLDGVSKSYITPRGVREVVSGFELKVREGEVVAIIGHSGCGKSTVLSMVAGLVEPTAGRISVDGRRISGPGLDRGVVFQGHCLLPWLTALGNVLLAVKQVQPTASGHEQRELAGRALEIVGLDGSLHRRPAELSAGMKQRVGLARALALAPRVLLLDEPFGMLDSVSRLELREVLQKLWGEERKTALLITHDVDEALMLSDRVVMMTSGPNATVGEVVKVPFVRPRRRAALLESERYCVLRERLLTFLEHQAPPQQDRQSAA